MSFVSSIGSTHPVSEISTSHVYRLKKTRNEGDWKFHIFLIKRVRTQCLYSECQVVEWLQWGRRWNIPKIGPSHPISWYLLMQEGVVVKPPEWKFMAIIVRNVCSKHPPLFYEIIKWTIHWNQKFTFHDDFFSKIICL